MAIVLTLLHLKFKMTYQITYHIYSYKCPGGDAFFQKEGSGGGGGWGWVVTISDIKNQLLSPVVMVIMDTYSLDLACQHVYWKQTLNLKKL